MANVFYDSFVRPIDQYDLDPEENIFDEILKMRVAQGKFDSSRFFLNYVPAEKLAEYDFNDPESLAAFREIYGSCAFRKQGMGGLNADPYHIGLDEKDEDLCHSGTKLSDPEERIIGQFDVRDGIMTYSSLWGPFYDGRDVGKFANDSYFTTIPFDQLIAAQINFAEKFYVHTGNGTGKVREPHFYYDEVSREQMTECATNPDAGNKILRLHIEHPLGKVDLKQVF